jgi:membrane fusion protein, copper/silver efflux system
MGKVLIGGIAIAAILTAAVAGYRLGSGAWPDAQGWLAEPPAEAGIEQAVAQPATERKVLYWKHPDGASDFSPEPKQTEDGRAFLPVYEDEEADFAEAKPKPSASGAGKILYYRNPMGLADTSPVPKKDWMGMDYIPVFEGEEEQGSTVKVSLDKVQRSGVRTAPVEMRRLDRQVRAPGIAKPDERTLYTVTLRADGFIEKLYANETGLHVSKGAPLFRLYSPEMVRVQVDYRIGRGGSGSARAQDGALQRLRNIQLPEATLEQLRQTGEPVLSFDWPSPASGVISHKNVMEGQMVKAGDEIFRLTDLSRIWVIADVAEQDIGAVPIGAPAKVSFRALPGETFEGEVTFILHELETATRTAKARIEIDNAEHRIKHEMFADVEISAGADKPESLVVPASALIDSGSRQVVIVDRGDGRFEPRPVQAGVRSGGFVEIDDGLQAGELVVVTANFLIDAESNLKAALSSFTADAQAAGNTDAKP